MIIYSTCDGNVTENIGEVEILKILCRNLSQNVEEKKKIEIPFYKSYPTFIRIERG